MKYASLLSMSMLAVALSLTQPIAAKPAAAPAVRLTPIALNLQNGCRLGLHPNDNVLHAFARDFALVGGQSDDELEVWRLGINGRSYRLTNTTPRSNIRNLQSSDRRISVRMRRLQELRETNDHNHFLTKFRVSISVTMNGSTTTLTAYETCVGD